MAIKVGNPILGLSMCEDGFFSESQMAATLQVRDYMTMKVIVVDASDSVFDAAEMTKNNIGCVVVTQNNDIAGIVTKGDIIKRSLLQLQDPKKTRVSSIMTTPVVTVGPDESLEEAARIMSNRQVSKLPVLEDKSGLLLAIITSTDIIRIEPGYVGYLKDLIFSKSSPVRES
jgi:CBS domain-containing protein